LLAAKKKKKKKKKKNAFDGKISLQKCFPSKEKLSFERKKFLREKKFPSRKKFSFEKKICPSRSAQITAAFTISLSFSPPKKQL